MGVPAGEAVKNIPEKVRNCNQNVPRCEMAGMRDKLIHAFFGVDLSVVWMTVTSDLPAFKKSNREHFWIIHLSERYMNDFSPSLH